MNIYSYQLISSVFQGITDDEFNSVSSPSWHRNPTSPTSLTDRASNKTSSRLNSTSTHETSTSKSNSINPRSQTLERKLILNVSSFEDAGGCIFFNLRLGFSSQASDDTAQEMTNLSRTSGMANLNVSNSSSSSTSKSSSSPSGSSQPSNSNDALETIHFPGPLKSDDSSLDHRNTRTLSRSTNKVVSRDETDRSTVTTTTLDVRKSSRGETAASRKLPAIPSGHGARKGPPPAASNAALDHFSNKRNMIHQQSTSTDRSQPRSISYEYEVPPQKYRLETRSAVTKTRSKSEVRGQTNDFNTSLPQPFDPAHFGEDIPSLDRAPRSRKPFSFSYEQGHARIITTSDEDAKTEFGQIQSRLI